MEPFQTSRPLQLIGHIENPIPVRGNPQDVRSIEKFEGVNEKLMLSRPDPTFEINRAVIMLFFELFSNSLTEAKKYIRFLTLITVFRSCWDIFQ